MNARSFNELALIAEQTISPSSPNMAGGQNKTTDSKYSYKKGTFTKPGGAVNQYQMGTVPQTTSPIECEEVDSNPVLMKIEELLETAVNDEMTYAIHQLAELKEFVKGLEAGD